MKLSYLSLLGIVEVVLKLHKQVPQRMYQPAVQISLSILIFSNDSKKQLYILYFIILR